MHGFTSNVLSCEEREGPEQELFEGRYARRLLSRLRHLIDRDGLRFLAYGENRSEAFPGGASGCGRSHRLHAMNFLLFSTEV